MAASAPQPRVALVASGGGGKGLAHLGVLRACEEAGLDLQVLVGTSAGAMACAFVASGVESETLVAPFRSSRRARRWGDFRSPLPLFSRPNLELLGRSFGRSRGLWRAEGIELFLRKALPVNRFSALPKELHIIATDLASSERVVFHGASERWSKIPVSRAVAASMCLPVVFRPYRLEGREYLDGSISRSLSLDVACAAGVDLIVASMVHAPFRDEEEGFARRGMLHIASQAINTMARNRALMELELCRHEHPEIPVVLVEPTRRGPRFVNAFSPHEAWDVIVTGYASARRALREADLIS